ncbi:MAG: bifunctional diguanylate cyclase/phosphodiesterase, partial [Lysobacteraceae bacterium]
MPFDLREHDAKLPRPAPSRRGLPGWAWALLVLGLCLGLTHWFTQGERRRAERESDKVFHAEVDHIAARLESQLDECEHLIRSFQSVFMASEEVTPAEFARIYANMEPQAGRISLQALAYAERRPGPDGDHYITTMYAPPAGNEAIQGLDVRYQPTNLAALVRSRDTNMIAMSAPFHLRQSGRAGEVVDGFILRLPVYAGGVMPAASAARREALVGSIGASFRIATLIAAAMPDDPASVAGVRVDDVTGDGPAWTLFTQGAAGGKDGRTRDLEFGGREWRLTVHRADDVAGEASWQKQFWMGSVISLLLAALTWSVASTRERAVALGNAMSERYRASEERFRKLNELLPSLVLVARRGDGRIVYRNAVARASPPGPGWAA